MSIYKLSTKQKAYSLFGTVLGDSSLSGNTVRCRHTNKQRDLVKFKNRLYIRWGLKTKTRFDFEANTSFGVYIYSEVRCKLSIPMRKHYKKFNRVYSIAGKKIVSDYVLNRITPIGILLWWLDDGSLSVHKRMNKNNITYKMHRSGYLNTHGFSLEENIKIRNMFKKRFDIELNIHKDSSGIYLDRRYHRLYFNATACRKLIDLIRDYLVYIPESMLYKFNMKYEINRLKTSEEFSKKYNFYTKLDTSK